MRFVEFGDVMKMNGLYKIWLSVMCVIVVGMLGGCSSCSEEKVIDRGVSVSRIAVLNDTTLALSVEYWDEIQFYSEYAQGQDERTDVVDNKIIFVNPFKDTIYGVQNANEYWTQISDSVIFYFEDAFKEQDYYDYNDVYFYKNVLARNLYEDEKEIVLTVDTAAFDSSDYFAIWKQNRFKNFLIAMTHARESRMEFVYTTLFIYDLIQNTIKKWIPTGESAWIGECNDIQWTESKFICIKEKDGKILVLNENQEILESLKTDGCGLTECFYNSLRFYGHFIGVGNQIYKIIEGQGFSEQPIFEIYLDIGTNGGAYIHLNNGDIISYTKEKLRPN